MNKKLITILLVLLTALSLAACGTQPQTTPTPAATEVPLIYIPTAEPAPERTPAPAPATATPSLPPQLLTPAQAPSPTPTPASAPSVTKSPTNENRKAGEQAIFVASANGWSKLSWRALSPNGLEISLKDFQQNFPGARIEGADDTRLVVGNLSTEMDGWGFTCVFDNNGVTSRSETATLRVAPGPETPGASQQPGDETETTGTEAPARRQVVCPICGTLYDGGFCPECGYNPADGDPYSGSYDEGAGSGGTYSYGDYSGGGDPYAG